MGFVFTGTLVPFPAAWLLVVYGKITNCHHLYLSSNISLLFAPPSAASAYQ
jgi:hypothetical protein